MSTLNKSDFAEQKEKICSDVQRSTVLLSDDKNLDEVYKRAGAFIFVIQQAKTPEQMTTIINSELAVYADKPQYRYLKAILNAHKTPGATNAAVLDQVELLAELEKTCIPSLAVTASNEELGQWLGSELSVNGSQLNDSWKKRLNVKKRFWFKAKPLAKQQWQQREFGYYLTKAGVSPELHTFIYQAVSARGMRCIGAQYIDAIDSNLLMKQPSWSVVSLYDALSFKITTTPAGVTIELTLTFKVKDENEKEYCITLPVQAVFTLDAASNHLRLSEYNHGCGRHENGLDVDVGRVIDEALNFQGGEKYFLPTGSIRQGCKVGCAGYLERLRRTGHSSVLINGRYCLVAVSNPIAEEKYYLVDTQDILSQGGLGKILQTYRVDPNNPVVSAQSPVVVTKKINYEQYQHDEIELTQPYVSIFGVVGISHNYLPIELLPSYEREDISAVLIIMEKIPGKALKFEDIEQYSLSVEDRLRMVLQLVLQVQTFHNRTTRAPNSIIHCDLKLDNVMFYKDAQSRVNVRVIDFGLADKVVRPDKSRAQHKHSARDFIGNYQYGAPEMLNDNCAFASDVYMLAPIIAVILGEKNVWLNKNRFKDAKGLDSDSKITDPKIQQEYMQVPQSFNTLLSFTGLDQKFKILCQGFLKKMSNNNFKARPDIDEVVRFFANLKIHYQGNLKGKMLDYSQRLNPQGLLR
jgi:hypothetical protein